MYNYVSSPTLTNVTFSGNAAAIRRRACDNLSSSPTLTNVIFSGNSATRVAAGCTTAAATRR